MAVFVTAVVPNQTPEGFDNILNAIEDKLRNAPGFIAVFAHNAEDAWRTMELWESAKHASDFFAQHVHPNLPAGMKPRRTVQELHRLVSR